MASLEALQKIYQACLILLNKTDEDNNDDSFQRNLKKLPKDQHTTYRRFHSLVSECHYLYLKSKSLTDSVENLEELRDRLIIAGAPDPEFTENIQSRSQCYESWKAQAAYYVRTIEAEYTTPEDLEDLEGGTQLCFNLVILEDHPERFGFTTRFKKCTLAVSIELGDEEEPVRATCDIDVPGLADCALYYLEGGYALDLFIREGVWPLFEKHILSEDTKDFKG